MKVLIVDDSEQVRRLIKSFIDDLVSEFVECDDGADAVAAYAENHPDLVLMDYEMKHMNGFDATREIKQGFPAAQIIIVSQWDSPALRQAARESGASAYVNKKSLQPLRDFVRYGPGIFNGFGLKEN
ncbi:MAG TPA: response regulator [Pyrinomonadaceae bacterium]|nr:response regulator [Pyrinomonadaceae bacterium]